MTSTLLAEPENGVAVKSWLCEHGGQFHPDVQFVADKFGMSVIAREYLPPDTRVVSCPFNIAITPQLSRRALSALLMDPASLYSWSERQLVCSYICFHWVFGDSCPSTLLKHSSYLQALPAPEKLLTPLHFTPSEIEALKGTNLYGATLDRERTWRDEWSRCHTTIITVDAAWGTEFTWERYLTASTYLSSRAFPSTLLSPTPSLNTTPSSYPVLLPGIDSLNHARAHAVSWVVSYLEKSEPSTLLSNETTTESEPYISLVIHSPARPGQELFNNYGAKANSELILGYGFSLPRNPDDTIVLKIGGQKNQGQKWEIGRNAGGAAGLWEEVLGIVTLNAETEQGFEDELEAAAVLADMTQTLLDRLPHNPDDVDRVQMRPEVALMLEHYLEGQRDVLLSVLDFAKGKERAAVETARTQGIIFEDE